MKEFLAECLEQLESLTGIRQVYYFQTDPDGKKKMEICIAGMLESCKKFPYIPEAEQQKIIREAMVADQDYEALNSRVIWKWLNANKEYYWRKQHGITEEEFTPASPEVADKYAKELLDNIGKIGNTQVSKEQIRDPLIAELRDQIKTNHPPRQSFTIDGYTVDASSEEEARKAIEAFKRENR